MFKTQNQFSVITASDDNDIQIVQDVGSDESHCIRIMPDQVDALMNYLREAQAEIRGRERV